MNYVEKWKRQKVIGDLQHQKKLKIHDELQEQDKKCIFSILSDYGIQENQVSTNSYWYQFLYLGLKINFVNQTDRLCGEIHRPTRNKDEEDCVREACSIKMHDGLDYEEFKKEFDYEDFVIDKPIASALRKIMQIAEKIKEGKDNGKNKD